MAKINLQVAFPHQDDDGEWHQSGEKYTTEDEVYAQRKVRDGHVVIVKDQKRGSDG